MTWSGRQASGLQNDTELARTLNAELLHAETQGVRMEAQNLSGVAGTVDAPVAAGEHGLDVPAFDLLQRRTVPGSAAHRQPRTFIEEERAAGRVDHRALDHVFQLADVARPRVLLQDREHLRGMLVNRRFKA